MGWGERLQHAWNVFRGKDSAQKMTVFEMGSGNSYRPDRNRLKTTLERSVINAVYTRIAIDAAAVSMMHVRLDQNDRFKEVIKSSLNECLTVEANLDQTGRALRQDMVMSLCDEGCIAVVPIDADIELSKESVYNIKTLRVGKILQWFPRHVQVRVYNEEIGDMEDVMVPKKIVAIVENPLYSVMNESNSTLRRLIHKMNLLDVIDDQTSSGKLDLIVQLPYSVKGETKKRQAEERRKDIEMQLVGSKYGIAYIDATEHITQLNRAVDNNLMTQITYLTEMAYNQLGMTANVFNGTASEEEMLNYHNRTIEPILSAITDELKRKFLTKTARSQGQSIEFFKDPFRLAGIEKIAEIADKFTRNEILSSNELRAIVGYKPVDDPRADELRNANLNRADNEQVPMTTNAEEAEDESAEQSGMTFVENYLEHHGIKGQKWGVKRGPPYPINFNKKKFLEDCKKVLSSLKTDDFSDFSPPKNIYFGKVAYKNKEPIGFVLAEGRKDSGGKKSIDISVATVPSARGQGVASSLAKAAITVGLSDNDIYKIYWGFEKSNEGSKSLAETLGFSYDYSTDFYNIWSLKKGD